MNLNNLTGILTNINTTIQDEYIFKNIMTTEDLPIAVCAMFQGMIIDSAKTMKQIKLPEILTKKIRRPYYFKHINNSKNLSKYNSPLSKFCKALEERMKKIFPTKLENKIDSQGNGYLDNNRVHELFVNESYDSKEVLDLVNELEPIYKKWIKNKEKIDINMKKIDKIKNREKRNEERKRIRGEYKQLNTELKDKVNEITTDECLIATACIYYHYNIALKSNSSFMWVIAPDGLIENLRINEDPNKLEITKLSQGTIREIRNIADTEESIHGLIEVIGNSVARFKTNEFSLKGKDRLLENGKYHISKGLKNEILVSREVVKEVENITQNNDCSNQKREDIKLNNYHCSIRYLKYKNEFRSGLFTSDLIDGKEVEIKLNNAGYPSLFLEGEFVGSITRESITNKKEIIIDRKFVENVKGQKFKVDVTKVDNVSLKIKLNSVD